MGAMKIAAFDFDGTIFFDGRIPDTIGEAIHRWQEAGYLAVAATGRSLTAAEYVLRGYDIRFDYSVLYTGAVVTDRAGAVLHETYLDTPTVQRVVAELSTQEGIAVYGTRLGKLDALFSDRCAKDAVSAIQLEYEEMDPSEIPQHHFIGLPIRVPGNDTLQKRLVAWIQDTVPVECVTNQDFIDIIPTGCTKGAGLAWLAGHLGVPQHEVELYTFGDSFNDLSMHAVADESFSFTWSPREVQEKTTHVVTGVEKPLEQLR